MMIMATAAPSSMPSGSNKFSKEQSNAKPDSSDKQAYFTVHEEEDHSNSWMKGEPSEMN